MNEQLQNTMNEAATALIEKAMSGLDSATGFLQAEIPEYVYQLMLWYGVKSAIMCAVAVLIIPLWIFIFRKSIKMRNEAKQAYRNNESWTRFGGGEPSDVSSHSYDIQANMIPLWVASIVFLAIFLLFINLEWIQIWIAPKVWLVEYASDLIK